MKNDNKFYPCLRTLVWAQESIRCHFFSDENSICNFTMDKHMILVLVSPIEEKMKSWQQRESVIWACNWLHIFLATKLMREWPINRSFHRYMIYICALEPWRILLCRHWALILLRWCICIDADRISYSGLTSNKVIL